MGMSCFQKGSQNGHHPVGDFGSFETSPSYSLMPQVVQARAAPTFFPCLKGKPRDLGVSPRNRCLPIANLGSGFNTNLRVAIAILRNHPRALYVSSMSPHPRRELAACERVPWVECLGRFRSATRPHFAGRELGVSK